MSRGPSTAVMLFLIGACAVFACCMSGQNQATGPAPTASPGTGPGLEILSPANGSVLPAGDITVSVRVSNFRLVPRYGQPYVAGEGHLHYYMSMGVPAPGSSSAVAPISYAATTATSYTWPDVPAGTYTFSVELANNDHSPFPTPVERSVTVTVVGTVPATSLITTQAGEDARSCTSDSDCVPEQCCHPASCVNRASKGVCNELCTDVCLGPIDCGAGHCSCVSGRCIVIPGQASGAP